MQPLVSGAANEEDLTDAIRKRSFIQKEHAELKRYALTPLERFSVILSCTCALVTGFIVLSTSIYFILWEAPHKALALEEEDVSYTQYFGAFYFFTVLGFTLMSVGCVGLFLHRQRISKFKPAFYIAMIGVGVLEFITYTIFIVYYSQHLTKLKDGYFTKLSDKGPEMISEVQKAYKCCGWTTCHDWNKTASAFLITQAAKVGIDVGNDKLTYGCGCDPKEIGESSCKIDSTCRDIDVNYPGVFSRNCQYEIFVFGWFTPSGITSIVMVYFTIFLKVLIFLALLKAMKDTKEQLKKEQDEENEEQKYFAAEQARKPSHPDSFTALYNPERENLLDDPIQTSNV